MTDLKNALTHAVMQPATAVAANTNSGVIDLQQYVGVAAIILNAGAATAGTNPTLDVRLYAGAESNGANAVILNVNFSQVTNANSYQVIGLDTQSLSTSLRYLKAVQIVGGTNSPSFPAALGIVGQPKVV